MAGAEPLDLSAEPLDLGFCRKARFALFRGRGEGRIAARLVEAQGIADRPQLDVEQAAEES